MQSTGHTSTQAVSLVPIHGSQMMYAITLIILGLPAWMCDAGLTALFTPVRPHVGHYEVCTTTDALDEAVVHSAGGVRYGKAAELEALEAFGAAGIYNRAALARLYGGRR